jgi:outer membrane protein assembly factor BamB
MSFDYSTGIMYAIASYNNDGGGDLYMVDLNTGKMILSAAMDKFFMSIAFDENGTLYGIEESVMVEDPLTWEVTVADAGLYTIDPATGSYDLVGSTGMKSNMYASMAFDFDTGNLYWNTTYRQDFWSPVEAKFCVVDAATGAATELGYMGPSGSQISALIIIADEYPASPEPTLSSLILEEKMLSMGVGDTAVISPILVHPSCGAELTFVSSDESVATVAADGTVTGVAAGDAEITVTATLGDTTLTASCSVVVFAADASMLAFENKTNTWQNIGRLDVTNVTVASDAQEAVLAAAYVGDTIYGFDAQHNFFSMDESFQRTILGNTGLEMGPYTEIDVDFLDIRSMAYDAVNERLLVLASRCVDLGGWIEEYQGSAAIYEVNMETGALTELVVLDESLYGVRGMTVDGEGNVYVYTAFDDYFSVIDMEDGTYTHKCTLQSLGIYGSSEHSMPMAYDATTGLIYCLFTGNGAFHTMLTFNPETAQVKQLGNIGELVYNEDTWQDEGPTFSALLIK